MKNEIFALPPMHNLECEESPWRADKGIVEKKDEKEKQAGEIEQSMSFMSRSSSRGRSVR